MIQRPNIVAIFEHYGLRIVGADRGGWRKALCPKLDHQETNPSASINEDEGKWFCHACNEGGDGLDIIMEREALARLTDAQSYAAGIAGANDGVVREERGSSGLFPRASGNRAGRGSYRAPWLGL